MSNFKFSDICKYRVGVASAEILLEHDMMIEA